MEKKLTFEEHRLMALMLHTRVHDMLANATPATVPLPALLIIRQQSEIISHLTDMLDEALSANTKT